MSDENAKAATQALLAVLPLLNRIVAAEVRNEAGEDTTMPQFRVLSHLAEEPVTLSVLARKRRVSLQSMGELVQVLVERGWVMRTPDQRDRRQALLQLTEHGRAHHERAQAAMMQRLVPLLSQLRDEELSAVLTALPALHRALLQSEEIEHGDPKATS